MKYALLTSSPVSAMPLLYYAQTRGIKFSDVVCVNSSELRLDLLEEYSRINKFGLYHADDPNGEACLNIMREIQPDVLVIMVSHIVRKPLLDIPSVATVNTHAGILPRYRGVDSRRWAILEGGEVGVTCHIVDIGVDSGPILARRVLPLQPGDTIASVSERNYYQNKWQTLIDGIKEIEVHGVNGGCVQNRHEGRQYYEMHAKLAGLVDEILIYRNA